MYLVGQLSHDTGNIAQRFETLVNKTYCPYARRANIQFAPEWDQNATTEVNITRFLPSFHHFVACEETDTLDMFVLEVRDYEAIRNIHSFARLLHDILLTLNKVDPNHRTHLTEGILSKEWDFTYNDLRFFVPTFAPFYHRTHARYSQHKDSAFITFQPDHCFDRHGITSKNPHRQKITDSIRIRFERGGSGYDIELVSRSIKAVRYIKPLHMDQNPIRWWEIEGSCL